MINEYPEADLINKSKEIDLAREKVCVCVFCVCNFSDRNMHSGVNCVLRKIEINQKDATAQIARGVS